MEERQARGEMKRGMKESTNNQPTTERKARKLKTKNQLTAPSIYVPTHLNNLPACSSHPPPSPISPPTQIRALTGTRKKVGVGPKPNGKWETPAACQASL